MNGLFFTFEDWGLSPHPLQAHWWLTRPIWDKQILLHLVHTRACPASGASVTLPFHLWLFSSLLVLWLYSKKEVAWHIVCCHISQSAACVTHCQLSMLQKVSFLQIVFISLLWCASFTIAHIQFTIQQGIWQAVVFHPQDMSNAHSCILRSLASILVTSLFRIWVFVMKSPQHILRIVHRQDCWNAWGGAGDGDMWPRTWHHTRVCAVWQPCIPWPLRLSWGFYCSRCICRDCQKYRLP